MTQAMWLGSTVSARLLRGDGARAARLHGRVDSQQGSRTAGALRPTAVRATLFSAERTAIPNKLNLTRLQEAEMSTSSPLQSLSALGQSVWIDFLSREAIRGGHLKQLIDEDAVVGATSNPTIFQKAMSVGQRLRRAAAMSSASATSSRPSGRWPSRTSARPATCSAPIWDAGPRPRRLRLPGGRSALGL